MTDYSKLVKALRECASDDPDCINNCPYYNHDVCADDLKSDAAAAIEELQAQLPKQERLDKMYHELSGRMDVIQRDLFDLRCKVEGPADKRATTTEVLE